MFYSNDAQRSEIPTTIIMGENFSSASFSNCGAVVAPPPLPRCASYELPSQEQAPLVGYNFNSTAGWW
ncbi:unnamed protein product [Bursaphelenchus xylophilus]|uniref:(pine wood nematode) hypothetical protein n=1 Tax=Bursaphelenchus xylophilus TaxID=6326 RepID=A0A1I7RTS3_BURXY|nr:unnamed protein product [Bursaphelenchus xylophilus]CAG9122165.1 unnamed protein product [Bursaphelenchus xylophilus]